ncbi:MAG: amidohydrolase family protein [Chloroflexota bacterium]|nr:amidohydrolase family protein [Chloroflexota bacterium]
MSIHRLPGLIDIHVHLREPGATHKEDYDTGTAAALAGGVTMVLDMPNTAPPTTDGATLAAKRDMAQGKTRCDVGLFLGGTEGNSQQAAAAAPHGCGLKLYLNQTYGPLRLQDLPSLLAHMRAWPRGKPIAVHAEGMILAQAIALAWAFDQRLHCCHVSRRAEVELIAAAKARGAPITCEVTPHHLFLTQVDAEELGPLADMRPSLGTADDQAALWEHLGTTIDCIASDHAPHTLAEKQSPNPPPGVPGLETTLPLLLTAVADERLGLERLMQLVVENPARIFGLPPTQGQVEVEIGPKWTLPKRGYLTRCDWSPFAGIQVRGRVLRTILRGEIAYADGQVLAPPGSGQVLFTCARSGAGS